MVKKISQTETVLSETGILGKKVFNDNKNEIIHISIAPEKIIPAHTINTKAVFIVTQGEGIAKIDGVDYELQKNDFLELEAKISREWRNTGSENLEIMVVKSL